MTPPAPPAAAARAGSGLVARRDPSSSRRRGRHHPAAVDTPWPTRGRTVVVAADVARQVRGEEQLERRGRSMAAVGGSLGPGGGQGGRALGPAALGEHKEGAEAQRPVRGPGDRGGVGCRTARGDGSRRGGERAPRREDGRSARSSGGRGARGAGEEEGGGGMVMEEQSGGASSVGER
ncbi:hypothetical protein ACP4OV_009947 [Aristida adscensionis]